MPLLRCATGGERGPMHGEPYDEDLQLMGELVHEVSELMGELGMEVIVATRAELAKLRAEYGVRGAFEDELLEGPELEMLTINGGVQGCLAVSDAESEVAASDH